ncbi:MAG: hypothetical protein RSI33_02770 [Clostridia bacterium]
MTVISDLEKSNTSAYSGKTVKEVFSGKSTTITLRVVQQNYVISDNKRISSAIELINSICGTGAFKKDRK